MEGDDSVMIYLNDYGLFGFYFFDCEFIYFINDFDKVYILV